MNENIPITFTWRRQIQEADWTERKRKSVMAVAFVLEDYADPDGQNVYPSNDTIAFKAGMNIKTVREVLKLMTESRFLRRVGKARYGQSKYRLIYPALPVETYLQSPTNSKKSKTPTNRTELPTAHSSPKGDIVAPSANTERSVSVPKVEVDRDSIELRTVEFMRPFFERGERVSLPESRSLAQKYYDEGMNDDWQSLTRTPLLSDMIRFMERLGWNDSPYESIVSVLSGECADPKQVKIIMEDLECSISNALCELQLVYQVWRFEIEPDWNPETADFSDLIKRDLGWSDDHDSIYKIVKSVKRFENAINESRDRVMAIRANAGSVSPSATHTGSDPIIIERIVESVKTVSTNERW
jgi:hypothetical protein